MMRPFSSSFFSSLLFLILVCVATHGGSGGVVITTTPIKANSWMYYQMSLATAPPPASNNLVLAILTFTLSSPTASVQVYAQYNGQPTMTSFVPMNQSASSGGSYLAALVVSQNSGTVNFGVYNPGPSAVTIANGLFYFGVEQDLPNPFVPSTGSYTIDTGTGTFFLLTVPEATAQALYFSLSFNAGEFSSMPVFLLIRRGGLPYNALTNSWDTYDYEANLGTNGQGLNISGWNNWYIKNLVSGTYYISLYNPDTTSHSVTITTYLTEIFPLDVNKAFTVPVTAGKYTVLSYFSDPSGRPYLEAKVSAPGQNPSVLLQSQICPTANQYQSFLGSTSADGTTTYVATVSALTTYCLTLLNTNPSGTYSVTVEIQQTTTPPSTNNGIVTTDTYGDGVEPIEVAGIVIGIFIGIFSLFFLACFCLTLLQMDRNYWQNSDRLGVEDDL